MFARVIRTEMGDSQTDPGKFIRENVVPRAKEQKGLKKAYWLIDSENRRGLNVAIFESLEDIQASQKSLTELQRTAGERTGVRFSPSETYELVAEI
ncbi:MAG TPA: hypothetical protein VIO37_10550 [Candidatus Dormibacteraeota bacterium]|jgi:hypothetical protein